MALVTMQDVLKVAEEKKIAIAAFTVDKWQRRSLPLQKKSNFRQS